DGPHLMPSDFSETSGAITGSDKRRRAASPAAHGCRGRRSRGLRASRARRTSRAASTSGAWRRPGGSAAAAATAAKAPCGRWTGRRRGLAAQIPDHAPQTRLGRQIDAPDLPSVVVCNVEYELRVSGPGLAATVREYGANRG